MTISKEAIEAYKAAYRDHCDKAMLGFIPAQADEITVGATRAGLEAALPFLPIAGEGKVKALEWRLNEEGWQYADTFFGGYRVERNPHDRWCWGVYFHGETGVGLDSADNFEAAKAAAQSDYETRILPALISSPGKDGGQEVRSTHEERIALAAAITWDVNNITPDEVRGIIERLAAEGFRLQRIGGQENEQ